MRILVLTTSVDTHGGVQYASRLMVRALYDVFGAATQVSLVTIVDDVIDVSRLGGPVVACGGGGSRVRTAFGALGRWLFQPPDLVVFAHINLAALANIACLFRRVPILGWVYSMETWLPVRGWRRRGMRKIDRLLYDSTHARQRSHAANPWLRQLDDAVCYLGLQPPQDRRVYPGGSPINPAARLCSERLPDGVRPPFALSIGRISSKERYKGHEEMIHIWGEVQRQRPGLSLVILGDGDDRPRLQALAKKKAVNVHFLGATDDRTRDGCLRQCQCFCLPSRAEGFGLVYLEAMREGKPVLAGSLDAGREVVLDGVTGRTVDAGNVAELLDGILDVSGPRAREFGAAGRRRFEEQFDYSHFRDRFAAEMKRLLNRSPLHE